MSDSEPEVVPTADGIGVIFHSARYAAKDVEAELPDGSRIPAMEMEDGRLRFESLPPGTWILHLGVRTWGPIGRSES
ncbi:MAG TPA: hypothetical protein VEN95_10200 [Actinomycetota bacterium]|nr:hypothetical protein [Actinomycetota bacterium]